MVRKKGKAAIHPLSPARITAGSFLLVIITGTLLLMLPFSSKGEPLSFLTSLFTATSATCVTGLTLIDPYTHLTFFGQLVLLSMIEIGGIGLVTFSCFFMISMRKKMTMRNLRLVQESTSSDSLYSTRALVKLIIITTLSIEAAGACIMATRLIPAYGARGIWYSIFTAVSAYCNAGFDLFGMEGAYSSVISYQSDPVILCTIMALIFLGGIGFMVFQDLLAWRKRHHLMLHTKVVVLISALLIIFGGVLLFFCEYTNDGTIGKMNLFDKILNSVFQSVSARTAGFASIDIASMRDISKAIMIMLMFIGAGSGSTGGGIKVTTFAVLVTTVVSVIRGRNDTVILGRRVHRAIVYKSLTIAILGMLVAATTAGVILVTMPEASGIDSLFEAFSAFGTVGVTAGMTLTLNTISKIAIIMTMFVGRIGPMCFALAMILRQDKHSEEILPEGRIMVG